MLSHKLPRLVCTTSTLLALTLASPVLAADTIKIGIGGALTGELASYGVPTLNAANIIAEEYNAKGGVLGKMIEIVSADDVCKPELASNAATSLISNEVVAVVGMSCSGATMAAVPLFNESNIILMSSAATIPSLTLSGKNKIFFRTIPNYFEQAATAVKFIGEQYKPKKLALLHDNSEYSLGLADNVRQNIAEKYKDIEIVLFEAITPGSADYSATIRKLRREGADFLFWGGYLPEAAKLLNSMRSLDVEIPMLGAESIMDANFILTAGEDAEGTYAAAPANTSDNPLSQVAAEQHKAKYNSIPGAFYDNGYAAVLAILNAIEVSQSTDTDKMIEVLHTTPVETPVGNIKFNKNGDAEGIGLSVYQVQNGKFVPVFTE